MRRELDGSIIIEIKKIKSRITSINSRSAEAKKCVRETEKKEKRLFQGAFFIYDVYTH